MAIVTGNGSGTTLVADTSGSYTGFHEDVAINVAGTVIFHAYRDDCGPIITGFYTGPDPATDTVAEYPGEFLSLNGFAINDTGTIVVTGRLDAVAYTVGPFIAGNRIGDISGAFFSFDTPTSTTLGR